MKIKNYRHKGLEAFAKTGALRGIMPSHATRVRECLSILRNAKTIQDLCRDAHMMSQGSKLEGYWVIKISAQWRIKFLLSSDGCCRDVDYINYH